MPLFLLPERDPDKPLGPFERNTLMFLALAFTCLIVAGIIQDFELKKLAIPVFFISWAVLLFLHELGHALMAQALGWRVDLISIGFGRVMKKTEFLGMPLEFRAIPISGFVLPVPGDLNKPRLKDFLIYAAGPGIELVAVFIVIAMVGWDPLTSRTNDFGLLSAQTFCAAAMVGVVTNLIPLPVSDDKTGKEQWTDGLGMILCWQVPMSYYEQRYRSAWS